MKRELFREGSALFFSLFLLLMPALVLAQSAPQTAPPSTTQEEQAKPGAPPVAPELVREGDFAIKLQTALGLGTSEDEAEAESRLGEVGIAPRNGWIADYPVTPDIIGELQKSVGAAADANKIEMNREEALKKLDNVNAGLDLAIKPHTVTRTYETLPEEAETYPNPTVINNYYIDEGPPVVTYYAPPPDYYYLYAWVPSPFWWYGFWFPGFFVLNDFHRPIFIGNRWCFVSNHFNDFRAHRVFRIDPVRRFQGRTFAGIGVSNRRGFISTGVPRSERRVFNAPRSRGPEGRSLSQPARGGRSGGQPARSGRSISQPARGDRSMGGQPARGGRSMGAPPTRGGQSGSPPVRGGGASGRGERR